MIYKDYFYSFFTYLMHPYRTHEYFKHNIPMPGNKFAPLKMDIYEALSLSWIFALINGFVRVILIYLIFQLVSGFLNQGTVLSMGGIQLSGHYFIILSTVIDVIFFPLFTLFVIQFWEFMIKLFARLLDYQGNAEEMASQVMAVSLSSHILSIVPIFGDIIQKIVAVFLMYAGLRKNLEASHGVCMVIISMPFLIFLLLLSSIALLFIL